jgi:hypothetical protein
MSICCLVWRGRSAHGDRQPETQSALAHSGAIKSLALPEAPFYPASIIGQWQCLITEMEAGWAQGRWRRGRRPGCSVDEGENFPSGLCNTKACDCGGGGGAIVEKVVCLGTWKRSFLRQASSPSSCPQAAQRRIQCAHHHCRVCSTRSGALNPDSCPASRIALRRQRKHRFDNAAHAFHPGLRTTLPRPFPHRQATAVCRHTVHGRQRPEADPEHSATPCTTANHERFGARKLGQVTRQYRYPKKRKATRLSQTGQPQRGTRALHSPAGGRSRPQDSGYPGKEKEHPPNRSIPLTLTRPCQGRQAVRQPARSRNRTACLPRPASDSEELNREFE